MNQRGYIARFEAGGHTQALFYMSATSDDEARRLYAASKRRRPDRNYTHLYRYVTLSTHITAALQRPAGPQWYCRSGVPMTGVQTPIAIFFVAVSDAAAREFIARDTWRHSVLCRCEEVSPT